MSFLRSCLVSTRSARLIPLLLLPLFTQACGSSYKTKKVKNYQLALVDDNASFKTEFKALIGDFNSYAGLDVLHYADSAADANSAIVITKGLQSRDGKVGWGQWLSETKSDSAMTQLEGRRPNRTVDYSMRLEFDSDYFTSRIPGSDHTKLIDMQKLFFHEVGHGLEMVHNETDRSDMMYPDVVGDKDFPRFFKSVRAYMSDD